MISDVLATLKRDREINYKRYRDTKVEHYLHYCSGLDRAIALLEKKQSKPNKKTYRCARSISLRGSGKRTTQIVARF